MEISNILKERLSSNIADHIMSYVGPDPAAAIIQEYNRFMDLDICPISFYWGGWNTLYGYRKRDDWIQKHYITFVYYHSEGGIAYIRDTWFIWHRLREPCNKYFYAPIPPNMELIYRNPSGFREEVEMVELPYICDSQEYYLRDPYGFDEPALDLANDEEDEEEDYGAR